MANLGQSNSALQQENVDLDLDSTILAKTFQLFTKQAKGQTLIQIDAISAGSITVACSLDGASYRDVYVKKVDSATPDTTQATITAAGIYAVVGDINLVRLTMAGGNAQGTITSNYN